jgi:hypothetical protein
MAEVWIKIADSAFGAGKPFEGQPKSKVVVNITGSGTWHMNMVSADQIFHTGSRATNKSEVSADLIIDINGYTLPDEASWDLMPKIPYKTQIADYVAKGILEVRLGGAIQTVANILAPTSPEYPY